MPIRNKEIKAAIFGFAGPTLSEKEREFFHENNPFGFIVFARNVKDPAQVKKLTAELKEISGRTDVPILIDQEGGRVARLKPPHFRKSPPAGIFFELAKRDLARGKKAVYINSRLIAHELFSLGINVDCAPVADILFADAHDIVGDRAFGDTPEMVGMLAAEMCRGLRDSGVMPIIKHIPGHGRAKSDSHHDLPEVSAPLELLEKTDFAVFRALNKMPWAMTAHITYSAIDAKEPATLSPKVISMIRNDIGFNGLLLTDDLSMKALSGNFAERCRKSLNAGCDIILHCNGNMPEMQEIAANTPELATAAKERIALGEKFLAGRENAADFDPKKAEENLAELLEK